ncbi:MAG: PQQ-binding-like beta-propeller repeat protein [Haloarculaceae archaeon]
MHDVETGEQLWEYSIDNTPELMYHDGVLYHHDRGTLTALAPRTGEPQWQLPGRFGQPTDYDGDHAAFSGDLERTTIVALVDRAIAWRSESPTISGAVTCWTIRSSSPDAELRR